MVSVNAGSDLYSSAVTFEKDTALQEQKQIPDLR